MRFLKIHARDYYCIALSNKKLNDTHTHINSHMYTCFVPHIKIEIITTKRTTSSNFRCQTRRTKKIYTSHIWKKTFRDDTFFAIKPIDKKIAAIMCV